MEGIRLMEVAGVIVAALCAVSIAALAPRVMRAEQRRARYARLCSVSLVAATVALLAASLATALDAGHLDTGRFLIGMGVGAAVGLSLSCGVLLLRDRR